MTTLAQPFASKKIISPFVEMGAYEALWMGSGASFKTIAEAFRAQPGALPSDLVLPEIASKAAENALRQAAHNDVSDFSVRVYGAGEYPEKLRDAAYPVELLYFRGS